ncbi:CRISPR-associated ring nuclease Crn3/Csx3 [Dictyoglomus thermophilum]|uniref:CRISPR-associated protein, Csx3 family n=3 Tax=Pseudomonadati TaxID=3379134 RepID=B5YBJ8_DICT6|nr:CRISPR-associated ring nuclease Crn3/Csx3 [Dictyoglomus thermophilum]ACI20116.1 CRISPR-associated protein, Csx3 family [Dictyoglomus thermophilum H-6-12]
MKEDVLFELEEKEKYTILSFRMEKNLVPSALYNLSPPNVNTRKGLILNGRGPIWLYAFLVHFYHPTPFLAVYDPRVGAVVIASHVPEFRPGDVLDIYLGEG